MSSPKLLDFKLKLFASNCVSAMNGSGGIDARAGLEKEDGRKWSSTEAAAHFVNAAFSVSEANGYVATYCLVVVEHLLILLVVAWQVCGDVLLSHCKNNDDLLNRTNTVRIRSAALLCEWNPGIP